ncbi:uncharacterized protein LOC111681277 [Lucilia cuprina]|uniref:uncharacterized protein LOC111681277 n=1 Tax=Lucilia cuprina TaxID=7375 RepID=UPI001F06CC30|nr:uncharacterized protein LOC111681277 [Lucilia cuprina]
MNYNILIYKWTLMLLSFKSSFSYVEEDGRIIEYDNFDEFKNYVNKSYLHTYDELRSRSAFEENRAAVRQHNALFSKGESSFRLRTNIMADMAKLKF